MKHQLKVLNAIYFLAHCVCMGQSTLRLTNVVYRHGDRTPINIFPADNNTENTWSEGLGELTKVGITQAYELGVFLRQRYIENQTFLNKSYKHNEIYVQSTDVNRCLMSAQAVLSGLYVPNTEQQWNNDIHWQPIPVHTVPIEYDQVFSKAPCPKLWEVGNASFPSQDYEYMRSNYGSFLADIHKKAGYNWTMTTSNLTGSAGSIADCLFIERVNGRAWPAWVNDTVFETLESVNRLNDYLLYKKKEFSRLRAGAMLYKMIRDMKATVEHDIDVKMFMYSGHDTTVMPMLAALGALSNRSIHYCDTLMLELHERPAADGAPGSYYVQLWYRTQDSVSQLNIQGCGLDCDLEQFINVTQAMQVEDRYRECLVGMEGRILSYRGVMLAAIISSAFGLLMVIVTCITCCCYKCGHVRSSHMTSTRKYHVCEQNLPEQVPMINTALSDED